MQNIKLLIIDPQIDFCDAPANGKLAIPGAWNDMERLSHFVNRYEMIDDIFVTLDTHHICDIAHSVWWTNKNDESPPPFTTITVSDIENGLWFLEIRYLLNVRLTIFVSLIKQVKIL